MIAGLLDPPGPRKRRRLVLWNAVVCVVVIAIAVWVIAKLRHNGQLQWEYWRVLVRGDLLKLFWEGLESTLVAALLAMVLSVVLGVLLASARLSSRPWLRTPARVLVELLRGLPVLMLIFFLFLGLPALGVNIPSLWALVGGLSLYNGALIAEVFRGGIQSLPRGQREAGLAVGMSPGQTLAHVLWPQAVRVMMPALISQLVVILKETSLGYIVGYQELLHTAAAASAYLGTRYAFPLLTAVAVVYIVLNSLLSIAASWANGRSARRYGRIAALSVENE